MNPLLFCFRGSDILMHMSDGAASLPGPAGPGELGLRTLRTLEIGRLNGRECTAVEVAADTALDRGFSFIGLRQVFGLVEEDLFQMAGRAWQILEWDRTHRFCGACGGPTNDQPGERAKSCPACGLSAYPRIAPAVIVAVLRGDRILLARSDRFRDGMYSVLAGFVEPGETLEECVLREVREEVGLEVDDVRYFGSQPWPFPHSLMIGFTARSAKGEIRIDGREIVAADWFTANALPRIPARDSIACRLINWFVAGNP